MTYYFVGFGDTGKSETLKPLNPALNSKACTLEGVFGQGGGEPPWHSAAAAAALCGGSALDADINSA